jgi:hypothetical protein
MTAALHEEWSSVRPFGAEDQQTDFTPGRIAIEKVGGPVVAEMLKPEDSFAGDHLTSPWNPLQRAYFNGYALWTYLASPFLLALPGFTSREIAPIQDGGRMLRGIQVTFPPQFVSHSTQQEFYVGDDLLLARHDYRVDVAGSFDACQHISDYVEVEGMLMATTRRAYRSAADRTPILSQLMVSIDLSDFHFW